MRRTIIGLALTGVMLGSCSRHPELVAISPEDSTKIVQDNQNHRRNVEEFFQNDDGSPFKRDTAIVYQGIKWFPIDPHFRVISVLHRYEKQDTVVVMGTRGEQRRNIKYGYFKFALPGKDGKATLCRLNVYKFTPYDGQRYLLYHDYLSVWFTDQTTGKETYEVGRYVDVGAESPDKEHLYEIDLNKAYNPYCAYSSLYSCAIPRQEDHLEVAVYAGEKKYHNGPAQTLQHN
jgi:uncharacterized protein (DUF1684 family)